MSFTAAWIAWAVVCAGSFVALELSALRKPDTPEEPRTLTANLRNLVSSPTWWGTSSRLGLTALLAWLPGHLLG